jgi:hypothetical protein
MWVWDGLNAVIDRIIVRTMVWKFTAQISESRSDFEGINLTDTQILISLST